MQCFCGIKVNIRDDAMGTASCSFVTEDDELNIGLQRRAVQHSHC